MLAVVTASTAQHTVITLNFPGPVSINQIGFVLLASNIFQIQSCALTAGIKLSRKKNSRDAGSTETGKTGKVAAPTRPVAGRGAARDVGTSQSGKTRGVE